LLFPSLPIWDFPDARLGAILTEMGSKGKSKGDGLIVKRVLRAAPGGPGQRRGLVRLSRDHYEPMPKQGFSSTRPPTLYPYLRVVSAVDPLREELLRPPAEGWRPSPGDVLIGEITAIEERRGFAERPYPVVTVRTDEGEFVAFHAFHTVAKDGTRRNFSTPKRSSRAR
jgi:hypothetical protein